MNVTPDVLLAEPGRQRRRPALTPIVAAVPLVVVAVFVVFAPWLAPDATRGDILTGVVPPGTAGHVFGTDDLGRDVAALAIAGARSAVIGPLVIAVGSMILGLVLGTLAGYFGGLTDLALSKYADLLMSMPTTLIALVVAGMIGGSYWVTVAVLTVLFSPTDLRMVRGVVLTQATRPYVEAAKALGLTHRRIMFRHIVPNVLPVALTTMLLNIAFALVAMSALSFLGLGVGPGEPDWGRQLSDARTLLARNWAAAVVPGLLIIVTATAINLLGDWAQERFEQRGSGR